MADGLGVLTPEAVYEPLGVIERVKGPVVGIPELLILRVPHCV